MGLFSGGNSSSTTSVTNLTTDKRVVADTGSVGVSGDNTTVNLLDEGSVAASFDFARASLAENSKTAVELLGLARESITGALDTAKLAKDLSTQTIDSLSTGYSNAKGLDSQRAVMIVAAVAVVALFILRRKAG